MNKWCRAPSFLAPAKFAYSLSLLGFLLLLVPVPTSTNGTEASWSYALLANGISSIAVSQNISQSEIHFTGGQSTFWLALRYNAASQGYDQTYVSRYFSNSITKIRVADLSRDGSINIVVATQDGHLPIYDEVNKFVLQTITVVEGVVDFDIADVDGDGLNEIVLCTYNHLYVHTGAGALKWDLAGAGGSVLAIGQMDADSALEIATTNGYVVDGASREIEWDWYYGFGNRLAAADIDGDGYDELIVSEYSWLWAYDVDIQLPKCSMSVSSTPGSFLVSDIDGDGGLELLVAQYPGVVAYDPATLQQEWSYSSSDYYSLRDIAA